MVRDAAPLRSLLAHSFLDSLDELREVYLGFGDWKGPVDLSSLTVE